MAKMMIDKVPDDVRKQFKAYCAINDLTMREVLISFMKKVSGDPQDLVSLISGLAEQAWGASVGSNNERPLKQLRDAASQLLKISYNHTLDSLVEEIDQDDSAE